MSQLRSLIALTLLAGGAGCSATSDAAPEASNDAGAVDGATTDAAADKRGARYCEVLLGVAAGASVHVEVYSTEGLNECPDDLWSKLDVASLRASTGATLVVLNGPRYWTLDSLAGSSLLDPTPRDFGGIAMRQAGAIDLSLAEATASQRAYALHTIQRESAFTWWAGKPVFELVGPDAHVYTMQSYSVQQVATQSEATLPSLGASLALPAGWSFRSRTLAGDLVATATSGTAVVVQDDVGDTYLQTQ